MSYMNDNNSDSKVQGTVNVFDYVRVIRSYKKSIILIVAIASVAAVVVSLLLPKEWQSQSVIIPIAPKGGGDLSSLVSQFGGIASMVGLDAKGAAGATEKLMAILRSRTLAENVINKENLMPILFSKQWDFERQAWKDEDPGKMPNMEKAVGKLRGRVEVGFDKKQKTIKIVAVARAPELSARLANAYVRELQYFIRDNAFTMAKRNRIFVEQQLEENKYALLVAGKELTDFYQKNQISNVDADVDVVMGMLDDGDTDVMVKSAKLAQLDITSENLMASDIGGLLKKKEAIDIKIEKARVVKNVPQQVYLTYLLMRRELLARVNALLTTQYEMAKINESKEDLAFQVIDEAAVPVQRFKPKRRKICMMAFAASLMFALFLAFFSECLKKHKVEFYSR